MDDKHAIKLECLKQAALAKMADTDTVVQRAETYFQWVYGKEDSQTLQDTSKPKRTGTTRKSAN